MSTERQNQNLVYLIDPSFQGANRLFCFTHAGFFLPKVELRYCNVTTDRKNTFDPPIK